MAFDSLSEKLQNVFKNLRSKGRLTEDDVKTALKRGQDGAAGGRCEFQGGKEFHQKLCRSGQSVPDVMNGLNPGQMVIKIVNEELVTLMGSETTEIAYQPGQRDYRYHDGRTSGCRQDYDHGKAGRKAEAEGKEAASGGL